MKAISFLGTGSYEEAVYTWQEKKYVTHLFPEAVVQLFRPERLFVLVTPQVKSCENFRILGDRLGSLMQPVDIPEGKSERELWEIFNNLTAIVEDNDELLLDITHAFRSIPLLAFTAAAYLRRTKGVTIRHIVYGVFTGKGNDAPILDLIILLDLLDWLSGVEFFLERGDATFLAEKVKAVHDSAWREKETPELPRRLKSPLAGGLLNLSRFLALSHPRGVMDQAWKLRDILEEVTPEVERWVKPFGVILTQLKDLVEQFAYDNPNRLDKENLCKQLNLIEYFLDKGLTLQAVLLAREWVISYVIFRRGSGDWLDRNTRLEVEENVLGAAKRKCRGEEVKLPEWFCALPESQSIIDVWGQIPDIRNTLAHCWLQGTVESIRNLEGRMRDLLQGFRKLLDDSPGGSLQGNRIVVDLSTLYEGTAKVEELSRYVEQVCELVGNGKEVMLTGQAPVWMYLSIAHALHGKAKRLLYASPVVGEMTVFDHSPE